MSHATEDRLKVEAAQRDPSRFSSLYEDNFHRVYAFIASRTGNRQQTEDLTAEVFREALANLAKFEWRGLPFEAWLIRIAANTVHDFWKRTARESGAPARENDAAADDATERKAILFQLVDRLPGAQRQVIRLRFVDQKSIREVAAELGRSEGAVKQLQLRALESLRAGMEGEPWRKK